MDDRGQSTSRRSYSMSTAQRPSQFTMFSNTTPHKHSSPLRRITARVRAHLNSSTESDITRRPRSHTQPEHHRPRVLSEGPQSPTRASGFTNTYPRGFRRAAGTYAHPSVYDRDTPTPTHVLRGQPREPGPHDLYMGGHVSPRYGLRTPRPLTAVGRKRYPVLSKSRPPPQLDTTHSLTRPSSSESLSEAHTTVARIGHSISATSSFVMLDALDTPVPATHAPPSAQVHYSDVRTTKSQAEPESEWIIRNGRRHLRSQVSRGVKQERKERKDAEAGASRTNSVVAYPVDYSPDTLASHALGHLLNSGPDPPCTVEKQPQRCLDLGCGGGEWIRDASRRWSRCEFVGMDLVLLHRGQLGDAKSRRGRPQESTKEQRVSWVKGDFLAEALPFLAASFDYVHLREIARGIPHSAWSTLMAEVGRILRPGGIMDVTVEDIIFPILPRSLTAGPTETEIAAYTQMISGRGRRLSQVPGDGRPSGLSASDGAGSGDVSRGAASGDTVRYHQYKLQPAGTGELGTLDPVPRNRSSEGSSRRADSTTPLETMSRDTTPKPRSRSRDMLRGAFSDGEGVRAGLGRILRGSRRSAASPPRNIDAAPGKSPIQATFFIPCVSTATLQESSTAIAGAVGAPTAGDVVQPNATVPGVRVSMDDAPDTRTAPAPVTITQAALGLGVPSFGMALSSVALGSALSLRSTDGSIINVPRASVTSLHPPQACSSSGFGHSSVVSFQGLLSPPLTPPRKELLVAEINASGVGSELVLDLEEEVQTDVRPSLGHDYELLEELFCAVYTRRGVHLQPTNVLPGLVQSAGVFDSVGVYDVTTVPMPQHSNVKPGAPHSPPTPDTSPKSGMSAHVDRSRLTLQHALQGVLSVREAMWEELVQRRDLADSPDERVRHERMRFEEMVRSYAKAVQSLIDVPNMLVNTIGWRRPVPREQPPGK
ncbi:hypothetical protein FRC07_004914 [Ceratobasidium sp. 392]|nr:hypothetical protein FRC07_004914 [Ceratobasidium sp. 392]